MSSRIDQLVRRYEQFCALPWQRSLAAPQRTWFVVYDKMDERHFRARITEFELATKRAGHGWHHIDVTDAFGHWLSAEEYWESFFESPEDLEPKFPDFEHTIVAAIRTELTHEATDEDTVVAISGIGGLFGFTKVSSVIQQASSSLVRGRLLVFFPGEHEDNNYRLLDARDGWNYLAIPIKAHDGVEER